MSFSFKKPFRKKKMNENKEVIEEHRENEEVKPVSEPQGPEIEGLAPEQAAAGPVTDTQKLQEELAEMRDKFLRLFSEFDNYKKRTQKERLELLKSASADVILALLPVMDDFERAIRYQSSESSESDNQTGVHLIYNKMKSILDARGLKRMVSIGEEFNVDLHEAITNIPAPTEDMKGKVVDEAECGYFLNDKVIRHAKVIVGS